MSFALLQQPCIFSVIFLAIIWIALIHNFLRFSWLCRKDLVLLISRKNSNTPSAHPRHKNRKGSNSMSKFIFPSFTSSMDIPEIIHCFIFIAHKGLSQIAIWRDPYDRIAETNSLSFCLWSEEGCLKLSDMWALPIPAWKNIMRNLVIFSSHGLPRRTTSNVGSRNWNEKFLLGFAVIRHRAGVHQLQLPCLPIPCYAGLVSGNLHP